MASNGQQDTNPEIASALAPTSITPMEQERADLLEQFQAPDAIMEPKIKANIAQYVRLQGDPADVIHLLSNGYVGYAAMAGIVSDWLVDSGMKQEEVSTLMHAHIENLILQNFNVDRANAILTTGKARWLNDMIKYPTWRRMIYHLSQVYPMSPLFNLFIKRICDAEYLDEIAQVNAVANEVDVFSTVVAHSISKLVQKSEMELDKSLDDFCRIACQSQHTYLYTQCLLHSAIAGHPHSAALLKRLTQELQTSASARQREAWLYNLLFTGSTAFPMVVTCLQNILNAREPLLMDVANLHELYSRGSGAPPVELLRVPALFEILISQLFNTQSIQTLPADHLNKCIFLVAYAASARDELTGGNIMGSNTTELKDTIQALENAVTTLKETSLHASALSVLYETLKFPVVSQGILFWLRSLVCDPSFFSAFNSNIVPAHLALMEQIATHHELLHPSVFSLLKDMFDVQYNVDPLLVLDLRRMLLDRLLYLLSLGYALPVMQFVLERVRSNDLTLTIHFVSQALAICSAPFSAQWVESFVKLLTVEEVTASLRRKGSAMVEALAILCRDMLDTPGLDHGVRKQVTKLAEDFPRK